MPTPAENAQIHSAELLPAGSATIATVPAAQTWDRRVAINSTFAPTSGTLTMTAIELAAGQVVSGITFVSGATAEATGTHLWYALYRADLTFMAQSTNDTGAGSFAANTAFRKALTAPQTCTYSGLYYIGFNCVATTMPTLVNLLGVANSNGGVAGMTPILAATSTASLTTTAPSPAGALTAIAAALYAFVD